MTGVIHRRTVLAGGVALLASPALAIATAPKVRRLSPALDRIVAPDAAIEVIATGIQWAEGPVWVIGSSYLLFSDPPANIMRRWSAASRRLARSSSHRARPAPIPSSFARPAPMALPSIDQVGC